MFERIEDRVVRALMTASSGAGSRRTFFKDLCSKGFAVIAGLALFNRQAFAACGYAEVFCSDEFSFPGHCSGCDSSSGCPSSTPAVVAWCYCPDCDHVVIGCGYTSQVTACVCEYNIAACNEGCSPGCPA